jgi:hypothetical protein
MKRCNEILGSEWYECMVLWGKAFRMNVNALNVQWEGWGKVSHRLESPYKKKLRMVGFKMRLKYELLRFWCADRLHS